MEETDGGGGTPPSSCNCATTTIQYVHTDHLSGSSVISNDSDEVVQVMDYYPFGELRVDEQTTTFNEKRKFTSHEYDDSTNLSYMGARYQTGSEGRFISQDPLVSLVPSGLLADPQQLNTYSYTRNNPIFFVDPSPVPLRHYRLI